MGRPRPWEMQEQGGQLGNAVTLEGRTSEGEVVGPGHLGMPGARVEMPKRLSVLQARDEICVLAALSARCDEAQLRFQDQACALGALGQRSRIVSLPTLNAGRGHRQLLRCWRFYFT